MVPLVISPVSILEPKSLARLSVTVPPSDTAPPPLRPVPAETVRLLFARSAFARLPSTTSAPLTVLPSVVSKLPAFTCKPVPTRSVKVSPPIIRLVSVRPLNVGDELAAISCGVESVIVAPPDATLTWFAVPCSVSAPTSALSEPTPPPPPGTGCVAAFVIRPSASTVNTG